MSRKVMILSSIKNNKGVGIIRFFGGDKGYFEVSLHENIGENLDLLLKIDDKIEKYSVTDKSKISIQNLNTNSNIDALLLYKNNPIFIGSTGEKYKCFELEKEYHLKHNSKSFAKVLEEKQEKSDNKIAENLDTKTSENNEEKEENNVEEKQVKKGLSYYRSIKPQLDEMFICFPRDKALENIIPNSQFAKVEGADGVYVIGLIFELDTPQYLVYGIPKDKHTTPPDDIKDMCDWLPLSLSDPEGAGYFLIYQDANNGNIIKK